MTTKTKNPISWSKIPEDVKKNLTNGRPHIAKTLEYLSLSELGQTQIPFSFWEMFPFNDLGKIRQELDSLSSEFNINAPSPNFKANFQVLIIKITKRRMYKQIREIASTLKSAFDGHCGCIRASGSADYD